MPRPLEPCVGLPSVARGCAGVGSAYPEGVPKDIPEAVRLYEAALPKDPCVSAFALGEIYADGDGVEQSIDRAEQYFTMARANLHPEAYLALKRIGRPPPD
jgi:TPR repeat protein